MLHFMANFFRAVFYTLKTTFVGVNSYFMWLRLHTADCIDFIFGKPITLSIPQDDLEEHLHFRSLKIYIRDQMFTLLTTTKLFSLDRLEIYITIYNVTYNIFSEKRDPYKTLPRIFYRVKNYKYKPYKHTYNSYTFNDFIKQSKSNFLYGFVSFNSVIRRWILSLVLGLSSIYFLSATRALPVNITLFQWFALAMFLYWLLSGFVFFIKKYQFTRFTSVIQRFWRRSYILFWLIESCLLVVFFYLTVNSSQESPFMLDQIQVFKTHLFSWRSFLPKLFLLSFVIIFGYLLLLNLKWNIFKKHIPLVLIITLLLTYLLWVEFYQIYHVSNFYANLFWTYDADERMWSLETDARRTRLVNHYVMILFFLKFWHIVFIYGFWIFFVLRANELSRIRYPIYSANFQNFIILYIMAWLFMYPWAKFMLHRFLEVPYFWFYVNNREIGLRVFFNDVKLVLYGIVDMFDYSSLYRFNLTNFYYWVSYDSSIQYTAYRKHWIRDIVISSLNSR